MVVEFVSYYARLLANCPEAICVEIYNTSEDYDDILIHADKSDVGKLIGKDGRMINSIKTLISGCKAKGSKNYKVKVVSIN